MTGVLALVGGREHTPGCEPIDRAVLASTDVADPVVAVVPLASSLRTRARAVGRAVGWWEDLGAQVLVAPPETDRVAAVLGVADVIVMTGGVPDRLFRNLVRSRTGDLIVMRWRAGAALVGSSSGAMVVGALRQSVRPPFAVHPGFGLLPGVAVAPHHELGVPRRVAAARAWTHPHATILGLDEATGVVGRDGAFDVHGVGCVTVRRGTWRRSWAAGSRIDLGALTRGAERAPTARIASVA